MNTRTLLLCLLASAASAATASAAAPGGHFRYGEVRMEVRHAYAFADTDEGREGNVLVFLTSAPIDPQPVADAFDAGNALDQQLSGKSAGYVRVCIDAEGAECGLYFSHNEPTASFNLSGSGVFKLASRSEARVEGSWVQVEPEDFFDKTYDFDLRFATDVTKATPGTKLGAEGGAPGRAYAALLAALAKGDLPGLHAMLGESAKWQLPLDDPKSAKEGLKMLRDGKPVTAKILSGMQRGDQAVLRVEGTDRDDIKRRGRVLMVKQGDDWRFDRDDLDSVE
ncbi:MAG TPA: hypothetical protein VIZ64_07325 [Dokdonella sp.]